VFPNLELDSLLRLLDRKSQAEFTRLPDSVLPLAKIKMALGQAEELPLSSSVLDTNWRACNSMASVSEMAMGEAAAKPARRAKAETFIFA